MRRTTLAGCQRQHDDKDALSNWRSPPRPSEKSREQDPVYNRKHREMAGWREGGGRARMSDEGPVMGLEQRGPAVGNDSNKKEGEGE